MAVSTPRFSRLGVNARTMKSTRPQQHPSPLLIFASSSYEARARHCSVSFCPQGAKERGERESNTGNKAVFQRTAPLRLLRSERKESWRAAKGGGTEPLAVARAPRLGLLLRGKKNPEHGLGAESRREIKPTRDELGHATLGGYGDGKKNSKVVPYLYVRNV